MRRLKVAYRSDAISDIAAIYEYVLLKSRSHRTAREFVRRIKQRCNKIGLVPYGGVARNDLDEDLRMIPFEHLAVILYKVEADRIRIAKVFYRGRDYQAIYLGRHEAEQEWQGED